MTMGVFKKIIAGILAAVVAFPVGFLSVLAVMLLLGPLLGLSEMRGNDPAARPFVMIGIAIFFVVAGLLWRFTYSRLLRAIS
jgi:hypothetical protein